MSTMKSSFCPSCANCIKPICKPGFYGVACNQTCDRNCREIACSACSCDVCDQKSGTCVNGCDVGWFGARCNRICSEHCFQEGLISVQCDQKNGSCIFGCGKGHFGSTCNETCSDKCLNRVCQQTTGYCSQGCIPGFGGNHCNGEFNNTNDFILFCFVLFWLSLIISTNIFICHTCISSLFYQVNSSQVRNKLNFSKLFLCHY